jgi:hypothetical protein
MFNLPRVLCVTAAPDIPSDNFIELSAGPSIRKAGGVMFEQEIAMEKQQSSVVPLLLIITLIVSLVGVAVYYALENRKVLASDEAITLVNASLRSEEPVTLRFQTGNVIGSVEDRPHDPQYRLLEKAGLLKIGKDNGRATPIALTPKGEKFFSELPGVTKTAGDAAQTYIVPLAGRKLVGTPKVTMTSMGHATVEFTWAWEPNQLGEIFDAAGPEVQSFNTWDRGTLIDKYEVKFYHGAPTKATLACVRGDKGWETAMP